MIVDDDERNLLALKTVMEDVADVVTASSGDEALRFLLKSDFAAILLDVFMPILDGYETAQLIRQREQSKRIPIIFLSAVNKEDAHLRRGYEMGAVDYVFKPVEPMILRAKVAVFVDLYEKNREIQQKVLQERRLREENALVHQEMLMAEQALRRAEQRQELVLQSLPIVLYLESVDASPRLPYFISGDFKGLTGYDFSDVQSAPGIWAERLHPDDRERVLAARADLPKTDAFALEYRWKDAGGHYRHLLEQAVILRDGDGTGTEVAGTLLDVTDQRKLEAQLAQAQKMDAVGKLTGGIAHDFNNLLAAVLSGLHLIEMKIPLDESQQSIIDLTRHSAQQGSELVKRLLAFARKQDLQASAVPVEQLVTSVKGLLQHTLGGLVELDWQIPSDIWSVLADPNQTELALINLIINARDAMPDGGTITVAARNATASGHDVLADGEYVTVSVADTGIGIPAQDLQQIFEPFFTTKEVGKGTGLGLSMVYGFAQQSGGGIFAQSTPGTGTSFELWLPKADSLEPAVEPKPEENPTVDAAMSILLVDDHPAVRASTHAILDELGHTTVSASSAEDAISMLRNSKAPVDLLITDYAMPTMSGLELINNVRKWQADLPAIIITGYADQTDLDARPDDVAILSKPFDDKSLQRAISAATLAIA